MFLGQHTSRIRANRRLSIPPLFRGGLGDFVYLTRGFESLLLIFPEQTFLTIYAQLATISFTDPLARLFGRFFLGQAHRVKVGAKGEIFLPKSLLQPDEAGHEVVLVGQGRYIELWSLENWEGHRVTLGAHAQSEFGKFQITLA